MSIAQHAFETLLERDPEALSVIIGYLRSGHTPERIREAMLRSADICYLAAVHMEVMEAMPSLPVEGPSEDEQWISDQLEGIGGLE